MKGSSIAGFIIIILLIIAGVMVFYHYNSPEKNKPISESSYTYLDPQTLYYDYDNNEIGAKDKYKNKYCYFTGQVYDIVEFWGDTYLKIQYPYQKDTSITIELDAYFKDRNAISHIRKGDMLTIYGKFHQRTLDGYWGVTSFSIKDCKIKNL